jgi:uncharacterized protein (TIGR03435 family)
MRRSLLIGVLVVGASVAVPGQGPAPTFDVASVRVSTAPGAPSMQVLDTRATFIGQSMHAVLRLAFRMKAYQVSAPSWLQDVRLDIQATLPAGAKRQQVPEMLQGLLAQRFGLVVHRELRPIQAYELIVGPGGTTMEEVEPANELDRDFRIDPSLAATPAGRAFADRLSETPDGPVRTVISSERGEPRSTTVTARSKYELRLTDRRTQILSASRMTMADLAAALERVTGEPILDKTNLVNLYKFTIELPPDNMAREIIIRSGRGNVSDTLADPPVVMTIEAVKKLGLRLERRRSEIETIVVDKIERTPTEN